MARFNDMVQLPTPGNYTTAYKFENLQRLNAALDQQKKCKLVFSGWSCQLIVAIHTGISSNNYFLRWGKNYIEIDCITRKNMFEVRTSRMPQDIYSVACAGWEASVCFSVSKAEILVSRESCRPFTWSKIKQNKYHIDASPCTQKTIHVLSSIEINT